MTTTTHHTISQLADIGAAAALKYLTGNQDVSNMVAVSPAHIAHTKDAPARKAFAKAILDAVGYEFPVDPEREDFDAWFSEHISEHGKLDPFEVWKAGREELRKAQMLAKEPPQPKNDDSPPWIEWHGGGCPLKDEEVEEWEYKCRDGAIYDWLPVSERDWNHTGGPTDIIAYKIASP